MAHDYKIHPKSQQVHYCNTRKHYTAKLYIELFCSRLQQKPLLHLISATITETFSTARSSPCITHSCNRMDLSFPAVFKWKGQAAGFTDFYYLWWKCHSPMTLSRLCRCFFSAVCPGPSWRFHWTQGSRSNTKQGWGHCWSKWSTPSCRTPGWRFQSICIHGAIPWGPTQQYAI